MLEIILWSIFISIVALAFAAFKAVKVKRKPYGTEKMKEISDAIHDGAIAFLNKEYEVLIIVITAATVILLFVIGYETAIAFVLGSLFSIISGNVGMRIATIANVRTAEASKSSMNDGLKVAFSSGTVMGLSVVGLGLLGISLLYWIFGEPQIIYGFGFGASSIALFARVGGGIYTKAADVGADLVGKVEKGIPEDDPRNPAVIADNVGDNVGDIAGMGADLFESYVSAIIATMVIGVGLTSVSNAVALPMALAGIGILSSIVGMMFVRSKGDSDPGKAMDRGVIVSSIFVALASYFLVMFMTGDILIFYAVISGLVAGVVMGFSTEYYTSSDKKPARSIAESAKTGAGTNVIQGLAVGMKSTLIPVLVVCAAILISYRCGGIYGIAISAVGMLSTLGITLATDTYGPVTDNAAGISEMAGMGKEVRERTERLDSIGNTTAAMGKGFAICSAALTALALFVSFKQVAGITIIDVTQPYVLVGLFIGAMLPFIFSALTMQAVGFAAEKIVEEVRRQFREIKGLMSGKAKPDYKKCVEISTTTALKKMVVPSLIAIAVPIGIGIWSLDALAGVLIGSISTGFILAVFMANSGGAWDNAKKYIERGNLGGKGSDAHKAAVVGDTVGDPFKDTAGPSLNILIKLMSIVALVFVPLF